MRDVVKRTKLTENCSKKTIKKYVDEVIQELTLDEKIGVMSGQVTEKKLLDDLFLIEHYNVKPYPTKAVERLGIPNIRFVDGPRGVVAGSATCFPVSMARGASFDRDLEEKIGEVIGAEVRAVGGNYYGGVCINLPESTLGPCAGVLRRRYLSSGRNGGSSDERCSEPECYGVH